MKLKYYEEENGYNSDIFIFSCLKIFANVSLPLQKHYQGIQNSVINYFTWNFWNIMFKSKHDSQW